jgi:hypothetical protein
MHLAQELSGHVSRVRTSLRKKLDKSLCQGSGGWWIPSIVACVVWVWLANYGRKHA